MPTRANNSSVVAGVPAQSPLLILAQSKGAKIAYMEEKDWTRGEGVYCHFETYPPESLMPYSKNNLFVIERVNGDQTVTQLILTRAESKKVLEFLSDKDLDKKYPRD